MDYYNEIDPYCAAWLRNLIGEGLLPVGIVDQRDIRDVEPRDLAGFRRCHFFAGIGIWAAAVENAGWPDYSRIWTGSCPCQPFSAAGARKGAADDRHLWPHWKWLIDQQEQRPSVVLGEQVASKDGRAWFDLVSSDLEEMGYAAGASDLCAAGFGAAHIRQRLYFVGVGDAISPRLERYAGYGDHETRRSVSTGPTAEAGGSSRMADSGGEPCERHSRGFSGTQAALGSTGQLDGGVAHRPADGGTTGGVAFPNGRKSGETGSIQPGREQGFQPKDASSVRERNGGIGHNGGPELDANAPLLGRKPVDWLFCRDGKWRPVGPGTFPLVDANPGIMERLRAYGNALDYETARAFSETVLEILAEDLWRVDI